MALKFLRKLLGEQAPVEVSGSDFFDLSANTHIRDLAFMACVNFTANALSKCEFKTFRGKNGQPEEFRGLEYYLWNVAPNQNENSSTFLHRLIHHLYRDNEALVISEHNNLYVADSYQRTPYALYEDVFRGVTIGDFTFDRSFVQSDVLFFRLHDTNVNRLVRLLYDSYGQLLEYSMSAYKKSRGTKGIMQLDIQMANNSKWKAQFDSVRNEQFKKFAEADNGVLPLYKGMDFQELAHKTYTSDNTRDIRSLVDDITDFTARAFGIPASILNGSVQDVTAAVAQALAFCIDPLADLLQEEINRKRYTRQEYLSGTMLKIDTTTMQHRDVLDAGDNIDKLIASGVCSVNDIRLLLGLPQLADSWAWEHMLTKNYGSISDTVEGGEGNEKQVLGNQSER